MICVMRRVSFRLLGSLTAAFVAGLLLTACGNGGSPPAGEGGTDDGDGTDGLPYTLTVEPYDSLDVGFHSFVLGTTFDGRWLAFGGKTSGFHGFDSTKGEDFPNWAANQAIHLYNPGAKTLASLDVTELPDTTLWRYLTATNLQHEQVDSMLYVTGGYGDASAEGVQNPDAISDATLPFVGMVDIDALAAAVEAGDGAAAQSAIRFGRHEAARVTGGELVHLPTTDSLYQVFGHTFMGSYSQFGRRCDPTNKGGPRTYAHRFDYYANYDTCKTLQQYANEIRRFRIVAQGDTAALVGLRRYHDRYADGTIRPDSTTRYRKRDLPVTNTVGPDRAPGFTAWAGVFRPILTDTGASWGLWGSPVHVTTGTGTTQVALDSTFNQTYSVYATAHFGFYNPVTHRMYTHLFGGIGGGEQNDDWVRSLTTLVQDHEAGTTTQIVDPDALPVPLGSEGEFIYAPDFPIPAIDGAPNVLDASQIPSTGIPIGYLFGGIRATQPQNATTAAQTTSASRTVYRVVVRQ